MALGLSLAPTGAQAASTNISLGPYSRSTYNSRCEVALGDKAFCLWYSYSQSESGIAYQTQQYGSLRVNNLSGYYFGGGGSGNGKPVRNDAAAMDCTIYISNACYVYVYPNLGGNIDWTESTFGGRLNQTWNNEASYYLD